MPTKAIYKPVSSSSNHNGSSATTAGADHHPNDHDEEEDGVVIFTIDGFDDDDDDDDDNNHNDGRSSSAVSLRSSHADNNSAIHNMVMMDDDILDETVLGHRHAQPMEISCSSHNSFDDDFTEQIYDWKDPWLPSVIITLLLEMPVLLGNMYFWYDIIGSYFVCIPQSIHLIFVLVTARHVAGAPLRILQSFPSRLYTSISASINILLLGVIYPFLWKIMQKEFFTEVDGMISTDWKRQNHVLQLFALLAIPAAIIRGLLGLHSIGLRAATASMDSSFTDVPTFVDRWCNCPSYVLSPFLYLDNRLHKLIPISSTSATRKRIRRSFQWILNVALTLALGLLVICIYSGFEHFGFASPPTTTINDEAYYCDDLDTTECWLPFPSFYYLQPDNTTNTGWRVHLEGRQLPPLKSHVDIQADFINELDGFSTMAPMLFYLPGLKEAHEAGLQQLQGPRNISLSVTEQSVTLLLDVQEQMLVPHSAEIDYLDPKHPLVMIFPAQPLHHNRHYAVAVVHAKDKLGKRLPPTTGLKAMLWASGPSSKGGNPKSSLDPHRKERYIKTIIPSLEQAAPWFDFSKDRAALQLLFDFHTISEQSQLGPVRAVRDATMQRIMSDGSTWDWRDHVRTIRQLNYDCHAGNNAILARTIHAELDVPWFLNQHGSRYAALDDRAVLGKVHRLGTARFLVHIPCSLKEAALSSDSDNYRGKPIRAVMEYGHGLFGNRDEASDDYLLQLAYDEGYVITAMDWRGMSSYDLLVVVKVLISSPRLFRAVRDNLIQGYASKYAMQHFSRTTMLSMDWFKFEQEPYSPENSGVSEFVPSLDASEPAFVFYGVSQGGILGAGYTALSGPTKLIDRAILTSPGTPFALIMTRSLDFLDYDKLLLLDFSSNRHIRMLLSLVQMAWDSVEASGVLAPPLHEPYPPTLIQAGLGDVVVPALASEALGRAYNASTLPSNPRLAFGIPTVSATGQSNATLSELIYDSDYNSLSLDNIIAKDNMIHWCLRMDNAMLAQLKEFVNSGRVIDVCIQDDCHRSKARC